ncbi:DUF58 domain-containing protein [Egibacter rhizosphaerae]|uniref:DUF58 domain-containing protein n=1 Tax=Egibacter rhizosphaerae TaxID=1670831 RepID=A0A411YAA1_9ACTN|nr:DUF58 domain-containing protein [Egibacter rhizosphaerae]QBI18143.1 DUF58 domain-containing protein [Egibacter rhizosphaerae]
MPTTRGLLLLSGSVAAWAVGRVLDVPELYIVAAASALAVVASVLMVSMAGASVAVKRDIVPDRAQPDEPVEMRLALRNDANWPTSRLLVEDRCPAQLLPADGEPARFAIAPIPSGRTTTISYELAPPQRGRWEVGPLTLRLRDPLGLAERRRGYRSTSRLLVYPTVVPLAGPPPRGGLHGQGTHNQRRLFNTGDELYTMREYEHGDDLRQVHWPTTARRGRLMVRQNELPWRAQATVLLDTRVDAHRGTGRDRGFERAVIVAASVLSALSAHGYETRLVLPSDGRPPAPARIGEHLTRLAEVEPARGEAQRVALEGLRRAGTAGVLVAVVGTRRRLPVTEDDDIRALRQVGRAFPTRIAFVGGYQPDALRALLAGSGRWRIADVEAELEQSWHQIRRGRRPVGAAS